MSDRTLAQALRAARRKRRLTQAELAARIGVTQGAISFWENGVQAPTVEHLIALALELPEVVESLHGRERALLQRLLQLERELFAGRCACRGCGCASGKPEGRMTTQRNVTGGGEQ